MNFTSNKMIFKVNYSNPVLVSVVIVITPVAETVRFRGVSINCRAVEEHDSAHDPVACAGAMALNLKPWSRTRPARCRTIARLSAFSASPLFSSAKPQAPCGPYGQRAVNVGAMAVAVRRQRVSSMARPGE